MSLLWKVLFGLLLTLPVAAYAAGALVGPSGTVTHRDPVATPTGSAEPVASTAPSPTPPASGMESGSSDAASLGTGSAGDYEDQEKRVEPGRRGVGKRAVHPSPPRSAVRPKHGTKGPAAAPRDGSPGGPAADSQDAPDDTTTTETPEDTTTTEAPEDTTTEAPEDDSDDSDGSGDEAATED